ncbi:MAG: hypothetical protein ACXIU7_02465 [Roseinatronobacter sp.]
MDVLRAWSLVAFAFAGGAALGYLLYMRGWTRALGSILAGHVLAAIALVMSAQVQVGTQSLPQGILLTVLILPSLAGLVIGAGLCWFRRVGR